MLLELHSIAFPAMLPVVSGLTQDSLLGRSAVVKVSRATKWHVEGELQ